MSRKTPTFWQLIAYMHDEKCDGDFNILHHLQNSDHMSIAKQFLRNARFLPQRKNGNVLFHEVLSISTWTGIDRTKAKSDLWQLAQRYITERCSENLVFGCLHEDHADNLHYHLLISANPLGSGKRTRLSKSQFSKIKQELEAHILCEYPHLEQQALQHGSQSHQKRARPSQGRQVQEDARRIILEALMGSENLLMFVETLTGQGYRYEKRGKHHRVFAPASTKAMRFTTLGVQEAFEKFMLQQNTKPISVENPPFVSVQEEREEQKEPDSPELKHRAPEAVGKLIHEVQSCTKKNLLHKAHTVFSEFQKFGKQRIASLFDIQLHKATIRKRISQLIPSILSVKNNETHSQNNPPLSSAPDIASWKELSKVREKPPKERLSQHSQ